MKRKSMIAAVSLLLVCILLTGMTLAYFTSRDTASNVVTMGKVEGILTETGEEEREDGSTGQDFDNIKPGQEVVKDPKVTIMSDSEKAYLRIKLAYTELTVEQIEQLEALLVLNEGWKRGTDGYFYYKDILEPAASATIFNSVMIPTEWGNEVAELTFRMDVTAELIQADYFAPEKDDAGNIIGWGAVIVEE